MLLFAVTSCKKNDPFIGRWTVEKVRVDFDEAKSTPEMVRQYGEMEKDNVIEISQDSVLMYFSNGDTLRGKCSLQGPRLFVDGKPFGSYENGLIETETKTTMGKVRVSYKKTSR